MFKLVSLLISATLLVVLGWIQPDTKDIRVQVEVSSQIAPENDFIVTLTIHRGAAVGFARIQQFIPDGFRIEPKETSGAQFIQEDHTLKFIWVNLPAADQFQVSYKVLPATDMKGLQVINGVLIYLNKDQTTQLALPPAEVYIGEKGTATSTNIPAVERSLFVTAPERNEYRVEIKFTGNPESGSARFVDLIPEGFEAVPVLTQDARFSFENGEAIFDWAQFPSLPEFTIAYSVHSTRIKTIPNINGMLLYNAPVAASEADTQKEMNSDSENELAENILDEYLAAENERIQKPADPQAVLPLQKALQASGVYYQVQICATMKSQARNNEWFGKHYKMQEKVDLTYHDGWKKYLIGSFSSYREAKAHRLKTLEKVPDAFVVAYDNGVRIPLKDALNKKSL